MYVRVYVQYLILTFVSNYYISKMTGFIKKIFKVLSEQFNALIDFSGFILDLIQIL